LSSAFLGVTGVLAGTVIDMTDPQTAMKAIMPGWFYPLFLLLIVVGTSINNALGIYSSGLALQAMGVRTRRSLSVLLDCVVGGSMTVYAVFVSNFLTTLNGFLALSVVWLGPYAGVFVGHLFVTRRQRSQDGVERQLAEVPRMNVAGVGALLIGALVAFLCANTTYWHGPISTALNGADLSPYVGTLLAAGVYVAASRALAGRAVAVPATARTPLAVSDAL
jgi:purine-cytosine permease-like protein